MKLSIFTPTHKTDFLPDAFQSILDNNYEGDWEWVILLNGMDATRGDAIVDELPNALRSHKNVKLTWWSDAVDGEPQGIGHLKNVACRHCTGDYLIELDHDDMLMPTAMTVLAEEIAKYPDVGFFYSDSVNFHANGSCRKFNNNHGWESYPVTFRGKQYTAMSAFEPTPASLHLIYYAPDHVRVWKTTAYRAVGGHDKTLAVGDDHDLICRTYIAGYEFMHIPNCMYMYRLHDFGQNTFVLQNEQVQTTQQAVSNSYTRGLVREWCRRNEYPMLDLGGAHNCPSGYQSVDLQGADHNVDIIRQGLPFEDNSVGCIRAVDFLEHIPHCNSRCDHGEANRGKTYPSDAADVLDSFKSPRCPCTVALMNEIYRVLVPGGWFISQTPSSDGRGAFQDPTHVSFWNPNSFWYYTRREQAQYVNGITCRFAAAGSSNLPRVWQEFPSDWHKRHNIPYVYADLIAVKDERHPGAVSI